MVSLQLLAVGLTSLVLAVCAEKSVVEVVVVVDKRGNERWDAQAGAAGNTVDQEARSFMYEVNQLFKNLEAHGVQVEIRIANDQIVYLDTDIIKAEDLTSEDGEDYVASDVALDRFRSWTKGQAFDVAMLITGYPFLERDFSSVSQANSACASGVGVVELHWNMSLAQNMAHEIATTLGVPDDGEGNDCTQDTLGQSSFYGYIMREIPDAKYNDGRDWSTCSIAAFKSTLGTKDCLAESDSSAQPISAPRIGQLIGADDTCMRSHGVPFMRMGYYNYEFKKAEYNSYNSICRQLSCQAKMRMWREERKVLFIHRGWDYQISGTGIPVATPEGMPCGAGKSCQNQACRDDTSAPQTWDKTCPFGEQPFLEGEYSSCAKLGEECKDSYVKHVCCESCK